MSERSDKFKYKSISFKIKKGIATDRDYTRLNLLEARITAVFLQQKLEKEYSRELVNKINRIWGSAKKAKGIPAKSGMA